MGLRVVGAASVVVILLKVAAVKVSVEGDALYFIIVFKLFEIHFQGLVRLGLVLEELMSVVGRLLQIQDIDTAALDFEVALSNLVLVRQKGLLRCPLRSNDFLILELLLNFELRLPHPRQDLRGVLVGTESCVFFSCICAVYTASICLLHLVSTFKPLMRLSNYFQILVVSHGSAFPVLIQIILIQLCASVREQVLGYL